MTESVLANFKRQALSGDDLLCHPEPRDLFVNRVRFDTGIDLPESAILKELMRLRKKKGFPNLKLVAGKYVPKR